jgi:hypothetical protein
VVGVLVLEVVYLVSVVARLPELGESVPHSLNKTMNRVELEHHKMDNYDIVPIKTHSNNKSIYYLLIKAFPRYMLLNYNL